MTHPYQEVAKKIGNQIYEKFRGQKYIYDTEMQEIVSQAIQTEVDKAVEKRNANEKEFTERCMVQLNKLVNECEQEGYNSQFLDPARKVLEELRSGLMVHRIRFEGVEYKPNANYIKKIEREAVERQIEKDAKMVDGCGHNCCEDRQALAIAIRNQKREEG